MKALNDYWASWIRFPICYQSNSVLTLSLYNNEKCLPLSYVLLWISSNFPANGFLELPQEIHEPRISARNELRLKDLRSQFRSGLLVLPHAIDQPLGKRSGETFQRSCHEFCFFILSSIFSRASHPFRITTQLPWGNERNQDIPYYYLIFQ